MDKILQLKKTMAKILIMYDHLICVPLKHIYFGRRNYRIEIIAPFSHILFLHVSVCHWIHLNFSSNWQVLCLLVKYSLRSEISVGDLVQTLY
jgi:hypothetical protein